VSLVDLLDPSPRVRARAVRQDGVPPHALRRVLFTDADANVRAEAARALGRAAGDPAWLVDALGDHAPMVRDAIIRALARVGDAVARPPLRRIAATDRLWWVRRAAIYALGALGGADELPAFTAALGDPFWRVRFAAVRVLGVLGARDVAVRDALADDRSNAATFLRASWGPTAIEAPARATSGTSALPAELLDPDPAVVTARLAAGVFDPVTLVELLCDPHAPLRVLAAERVAASGERRAYVAALDWLEEPRVPHVAATVERMLDGLGDDAVGVVAHALARHGRGERAGAARWAIGWVAATRHEPFADLALARARGGAAELRRAALRLASTEELVAWAAEPELVDAIADELDARRAADAVMALDVAAHPRASALRVAAAARLGRWDVVEAALVDAHHGPRAVAVRALVRAGRIDAAAYAGDVDPAIREAAVTAETAVGLVDDADPWVVRAAIDALVRAGEGGAGGSAAATRALASPDPVVRAQACGVAIEGDVQLAAVAAALADDDAGVRAAAQEALDRARFDVDARLRAVVAELDDKPRAMVAAYLGRRAEEVADIEAAVAEIVAVGERDREKAEQRSPAPALAPMPTPQNSVERRRFGKAGFEVAPLAISGAYGLSPSSLAAAVAAGVDLFFWEPSYDNLTRFLQRRPNRGLRVIAGSYHADAASIEADVDRARRWLRREAIDVFLLFWSRSPARVEPSAYAALARLKDAGKVRAIGFSTHDRALARAAIAASPWDVVMTRHSAAHPGAEAEVLPTARAHDTAILAFSALCYGRMIAGPDAPTAADCYRYSLSQPGVTAVISAPRRRDELVDNLAALHAPPLADADLARLRAHGAHVRAENQRFNALMREPTRDAAAAARELLEHELPPAGEIAIRPMPRAAGRAARTSLGTTRRRG
jgi:hypothetical protein